MRIIGRIDKALLTLVGACVFLFVATVVAPGLQTTVASAVCPTGTVDAVVVRYPHVEEPPAMVRNTPLVCVLDGRAELASHAKVLPALLAVGVAGSAVSVIAIALLVGLVRRPPTGHPEPRRTPMGGLSALPLAIALPFVFLSSYGLYWWLAVDTPYRSESCRSSSGGSATCSDGEPVYRLMSLLFLAFAVAGIVIWAAMVVRAARRRSRFAETWRDGVTANATLVDVESTNTKINGSRLKRFTFEVEPRDGSPSFRFVEKSTRYPGGGVGTRVEVVYQRADPPRTVFLMPEGAVHESAAPSDRPVIAPS